MADQRRSSPSRKPTVTAHIYDAKVMQHLYNYGPTTTDDLTILLRISRDFMDKILGNLHTEGKVARIMTGTPRKSHWILAQDKEAEPEPKIVYTGFAHLVGSK